VGSAQISIAVKVPCEVRISSMSPGSGETKIFEALEMNAIRPSTQPHVRNLKDNHKAMGLYCQFESFLD